MATKGKVVQVIGPVVDIEFPAGELPEILNAVTIKGKAGEVDIDLVVAIFVEALEVVLDGWPSAAGQDPSFGPVTSAATSNASATI